MRTKFLNTAIGFLLCLTLSFGPAAGVITVRAEEADTIRYEDLRELLKSGNLALKKTISDYETNVNNYQEMWDTFKWEQDNMEDRAENGDYDEEMKALYNSNASMLKSSASRIYQQLDALQDERSTRSVEKSVDSYTYAAQTLMNSCSQLYSSLTVREKQVEALEAAYNAMVRKQEAGSATAAQVLEAKKSLDAGRSQAASLKEQADQSLYKLKVMLGLQNTSAQLSEMPGPDLSAVDAIDFEADKQKAIGNDKSVQSARHSKANSTAQYNQRFREVNEAEGTAEAGITAAYEDLQVKKGLYLAAEQAFQSASQVYQSLERKKQAGMLNNTQYLEGQVQYLQKKSARDIASMNLLQAYESYCWEVQGIS
ncbi:MAG: TolC family protein [Enterocloster sp.]